MKPRIKRDKGMWKCVRIERGELVTGYGSTPEAAWIVCMDSYGIGVHPFRKAI